MYIPLVYCSTTKHRLYRWQATLPPPSPPFPPVSRIFHVTHARALSSVSPQPMWPPPPPSHPPLPYAALRRVVCAIYILPRSIHVYRCYKHFYDNRNAVLTSRGYRRSLIIRHCLETIFSNVRDRVKTCLQDTRSTSPAVDRVSIFRPSLPLPRSPPLPEPPFTAFTLAGTLRRRIKFRVCHDKLKLARMT